MGNKQVAKSMLIWLSIIPLAILNGSIREYLLRPQLGNVATPLSGLLLMLCIFTVSYIFIPRLGFAKKIIYIKMGLLWIVATVIFEFLLGIVMGTPLSDMLQSYNVLTGNLWLIVVIFTGFIPTIVAKLKRTTSEM